MNRRRIALVTGAGLFGGHFNQGVPALMELVTNLAQRHELHVFAGNLSSDAAKKSLNYKLQRLPGRLRFPAALASIAKAHARKKFDLIHGFWGTAGGFYAVAAGKLLKVPSIVSLLGGEAAAVTEIGYGSMLSPRLASRLRWVCGQADAVTALSNFQISRLQENGFDVTDIQRIPLGADNEKFAYSERQWSAPWRFLHVANINEVKDQVTLLRAFELIHRAADAIDSNYPSSTRSIGTRVRRSRSLLGGVLAMRGRSCCHPASWRTSPGTVAGPYRACCVLEMR